MGGSTADTPEFLRASDAERDQAVSELRNEFAEGRLSHETFMYRMQSALDARNRDQLAGLFTDLPPHRPGPKSPKGPKGPKGPRKLLARIRVALRGEEPAARGGRADGDLETQRIAGPRHGPWPQGIGWTEHNQASQRRPVAQPPGAQPPRVGADPAPLVFPPGSGVRFTIGRTRDCDLCLTDLSVSRLHALLVRREGGWVLSDLGSHNGTRLNGWLIREPVPVRAGDRVEFGSMAFIIQGDPPAEPPPGSSGFWESPTPTSPEPSE